MKMRVRNWRRIAFCCLLASWLGANTAAALDGDKGLAFALVPGLKYDSRMRYPISFDLDGRLSFLSEHFDLVAELSAHNDGKYGPELIDLGNGKVGSIYAFLEEGGMRFHADALSLSVGRLRQLDEVDSPYSLFINSTRLTTLAADFRYDNGRLFYETRWLGLNHDSGTATPAWPNGFPERGAAYKVYGMRFGEFSLGYQDVAVWSQRWLDAEYFLSPLPSYFTQYVRSTGGRPWQDNHDDNTIMGLFAKWERPGAFELNAQFLLDDLGVFGNSNPWQMAAEVGGRKETKIGSFGFYAAMATQYTFAPSYGSPFNGSYNPYGYTYYPDTEYQADWGTGNPIYEAFAIEDNEIGYKYGENNLAVQVDWRGRLLAARTQALLEFRLAGTNSPANPWGDLTNQPAGTRWLSDPVLEKRILLGFDASMPLGGLSLELSLRGGVALDALALRPPADVSSTSPLDSTIDLWAPVPGLVQPFGRVTLGLVFSTRP